jgi:hypothetical protein
MTPEEFEEADDPEFSSQRNDDTEGPQARPTGDKTRSREIARKAPQPRSKE